MSRGLTRILACIWSAWAGFGLPCIIRLASGAGSGSSSYLCVCSPDQVLAAVRHDLVHSFVISGSGRRERIVLETWSVFSRRDVVLGVICADICAICIFPQHPAGCGSCLCPCDLA